MKKCTACNDSIFVSDPSLNLDGVHYHAWCARCKACDCKITLLNFTAPSADGAVLCKVHYTHLFHQGGAYAGDEKFAKSSSTINRTMWQPALTQTALVPGAEKAALENEDEMHAAEGGDAEQEAPPPLCDKPTATHEEKAASKSAAEVLALTRDGGAADATEGPGVGPGTRPPPLLEASNDKEDGDHQQAEPGGPVHEACVSLPVGVEERPLRGIGDGVPAVGSGGSTVHGGRKENSCQACGTTVYAADPQLTLGRFRYHKMCAKCDDCKTKITLANCTAPNVDGSLLCTVHMQTRFKQEGKYRGGEQFKHQA